MRFGIICLFPFCLVARDIVRRTFHGISRGKTAASCSMTYAKAKWPRGSMRSVARSAPPACSTFKVALALMAFDKALLKDESTFFKWDGKDHGMAAWNKDQTAAPPGSVTPWFGFPNASPNN